MSSAIDTLSRSLLPWLSPALEQLDTARRAGNLGHAWLISGPAGVGKLNVALVLACRLFGDDSEPAVLDAGAALAAMAARHELADRHPDLHWVHPEEDKETISVDQIRTVIDEFTLTYPGIKNVEREYFYAVHGADDATRKGYLERAYALGRQF